MPRREQAQEEAGQLGQVRRHRGRRADGRGGEADQQGLPDHGARCGRGEREHQRIRRLGSRHPNRPPQGVYRQRAGLWQSRHRRVQGLVWGSRRGREAHAARVLRHRVARGRPAPGERRPPQRDPLLRQGVGGRLPVHRARAVPGVAAGRGRPADGLPDAPGRGRPGRAGHPPADHGGPALPTLAEDRAPRHQAAEHPAGRAQEAAREPAPGAAAAAADLRLRPVQEARGRPVVVPGDDGARGRHVGLARAGAAGRRRRGLVDGHGHDGVDQPVDALQLGAAGGGPAEQPAGDAGHRRLLARLRLLLRADGRRAPLRPRRQVHARGQHRQGPLRAARPRPPRRLPVGGQGPGGAHARARPARPPGRRRRAGPPLLLARGPPPRLPRPRQRPVRVGAARAGEPGPDGARGARPGPARALRRRLFAPPARRLQGHAGPAAQVRGRPAAGPAARAAQQEEPLRGHARARARQGRPPARRLPRLLDPPLPGPADGLPRRRPRAGLGDQGSVPRLLRGVSMSSTFGARKLGQYQWAIFVDVVGAVIVGSCVTRLLQDGPTPRPGPAC